MTYVHAAIHGGVHAFQTEMEELAFAHPSLQYYIVYEKPHEEDKQRAHFAQAGYIDLALLDARVPRDAEFYVCGPKPFMKSMVTSLQQLNVSSDHIHYEFFGPQGSLE